MDGGREGWSESTPQGRDSVWRGMFVGRRAGGGAT